MCRRAYGYIRSERDDASEVDRLTREVRDYARRRGLRLAEVFSDAGVPSTTLVRPGFTALLNALTAAAAPVVVLPSRSHLSRQPALRNELELQIRELGVPLQEIEPGIYLS